MPTLVIIDAREQLGVSRCGLVAPRAYYDLHHGLGKRVISNVVHVIRVATGEISESLTDEGTSKAAVELGRKGGLARAKKIPKLEGRQSRGKRHYISVTKVFMV